MKEFADIFVLSLAEVIPVEITKHRLEVKPGTTLPKKVHQRLLNNAQKAWWMRRLDEMERAGICARVPADSMKCASSTNLPPKDAGDRGITRDEIIAQTNRLCEAAGYPPY